MTKNFLVESASKFDCGLIKDEALLLDTDDMGYATLLEDLTNLLRVARCQENKLNHLLRGLEKRFDLFLCYEITRTVLVLE